MEFSRIDANHLEKTTLKAEYYGREFRRVAELIGRFPRLVTLDEIRRANSPIRRGIDMPRIVTDKAAPVLVTIAAFADPGLNFIGLERIDRQQHLAFSGSSISRGDLLVAMGGYVGAAAIVPGDCPEANIGRHTARVVIDDDKTDKYFTWAFIRSRIGTVLFSREITGSVQAGINLEDLRVIQIPSPDSNAQRYIGNKVRQAEHLRKQSLELEVALETVYESSIPVVRTSNSRDFAWRPRGAVLDAIRLDPKYYAPEYLHVAESTANEPFVPLCELVDDIRYGASVEADYVTRGEGLPFVRGTDLIRNRICFTESVDISPRLRDCIGDNLLQEGQLLITRSGTVGIAAAVTPEVAGAAYGSFMMSMRPKAGVDPYFLAWFLNSWVGVNQLRRRENGAIQLNINIQELSSVRIWKASDEVQREVASLVQRWQSALENAELLTRSSTMMVEALIESNLSEDEISDAQKALERGDNSLDRTILTRLTKDGIDLPNNPPLFPDLDALYAAINDTLQGELTTGGTP